MLFILGLLAICTLGTLAVVSLANHFPLTIGDRDDKQGW